MHACEGHENILHLEHDSLLHFIFMTDFDSLYGGYNYAQTDVFSLLS